MNTLIDSRPVKNTMSPVIYEIFAIHAKDKIQAEEMPFREQAWKVGKWELIVCH